MRRLLAVALVAASLLSAQTNKLNQPTWWGKTRRCSAAQISEQEPLPRFPRAPAKGANGTRFGSDPSLAFGTSGKRPYSYIVVFSGNGNGVNGSEVAVAKSTDGGDI